MSENEKTTDTAPKPVSAKRTRTVGLIACLAGVLAALLALVGILTSDMDMLYLLLLGGGMLVAVLGIRNVRRVAGGKK